MEPRNARMSAGILSGFILLSTACPAFATDDRDVVHSQASKVVVSSDNKCVRTKWSSGSDECSPPSAPAAVPVVQHSAVIGKEDRTVYFDFNKTTLTADSQAKLNSLAEKLKSDQQVKQARIVGYADRIGRASYNQKLSEKRAGVVGKYLISRGFINARVAETRWFGSQYPATHCPDGMKRPELIECLQKDRRVEVEIDYYPVGHVPGNR